MAGSWSSRKHDLGYDSFNNWRVRSVGGHYVSGELAFKVMLKGLSGFLQRLLREDTTRLKPFGPDTLLIGFATEPTGAESFTEIALTGIKDVSDLGTTASCERPTEKDIAIEGRKAFFDMKIDAPSSVFAARGVDPTTDAETAMEVAREWHASKLGEMRRLLGLNMPG